VKGASGRLGPTIHHPFKRDEEDTASIRRQGNDYFERARRDLFPSKSREVNRVPQGNLSPSDIVFDTLGRADGAMEEMDDEGFDYEDRERIQERWRAPSGPALMSSRHLNLNAGTGAAAASRPPGREDYRVINRDSTWEEVIVDDQVGLICHGDHERNISTVILNILKTSQLAGQ